MARNYLKTAAKTAMTDSGDVRDTVQKILSDIEAGGDQAALAYATKFDKYEGSVILSAEEIAAASALVPEKLKADIQIAHDNVRRFAELQKSTMTDVEIEIVAWLDCRSKGDPCARCWLLCSRRTLFPYCQRDHDRYHRKGCWM